MKKEKRIASRWVHSFNASDGSDGVTPVRKESHFYKEAQRLGVGSVIRSWAGAPGTGYVDERITRVTSRAVYGYTVTNTMRELTAAEVY